MIKTKGEGEWQESSAIRQPYFTSIENHMCICNRLNRFHSSLLWCKILDMVIMGMQTGQLANRMLAFAHFIANAIEYNYTLINPTFGIYRQYFVSTVGNDFENHSIRIGLTQLSRILHLSLRFLHARIPNSPFHAIVAIDGYQKLFDLNTPDFQRLVQQKQLVFAYGWRFRDYSNLQKHAEITRKFFRPIPIHQKRIDNLIKRSRSKADFLVGVHIRRRDYRQWQNGKYFYSDQTYLDKMQQLDELLKRSGKSALYLLFSDETINIENFQSLPTKMGNDHFVEDLYSLAACDYIIGPPSTYTMWASFYGQVPRMVIVDSTQVMRIQDSAVVQG